jgi:hypothetical protein
MCGVHVAVSFLKSIAYIQLSTCLESLNFCCRRKHYTPKSCMLLGNLRFGVDGEEFNFGEFFWSVKLKFWS